MGEATKQHRSERIATAIIGLGLAAALAVVGYFALSYRAAFEQAEQREMDVENRYLNTVHNYARGMTQIFNTVKTIEPPGRLAHADVGLYSARIVGTSDDYHLIFDWTGVDPNPYAAEQTNERDVLQTLKLAPLARVYLLGSASPDDPDFEGLRPVGSKAFFRMLRTGDATSTALLESDWLVSVVGPEIGAVVQSP